jgi:ADP-ribosylglycohydrolase
LQAHHGPSHDDELRDRFRATLLGCAIGDALGFPFEGAPPEALARVPELAEDFRPRPRGRYAKGQYTDDTQMTLALAASIAEEGKVDGRAVAQRFAQLWRDGIILEAGESTTEAIKRVLKGKPWMSSGAEVGQAGNGAAMRSSPIGLWHFDRPTKVSRDAEIQGVITHKDPRALAGGAAIAAAVACVLDGQEPTPRHLCNAVAEAANSQSPEFASHLHDLPRLLKWEVRSAVAAIWRMGLGEGELPEAPGISSFVIPSVMISLYSFLREPNDFRAALRLVLRAGGDVDTTGAMTGAISGAWLGMAGLPARLRKGVLHADVIVEIADLLYARKFPTPRAHGQATVPARSRVVVVKAHR